MRKRKDTTIPQEDWGIQGKEFGRTPLVLLFVVGLECELRSGPDCATHTICWRYIWVERVHIGSRKVGVKTVQRKMECCNSYSSHSINTQLVKQEIIGTLAWLSLTCLFNSIVKKYLFGSCADTVTPLPPFRHPHLHSNCEVRTRRLR